MRLCTMSAFTPSSIVQQKKYTLEPVITEATNSCSDQDEYYMFNSIIRLRESRNVEFKAAQGKYIYNMLPETLPKYACAFVNGEGGTLYLGVCDDGRVQGINWNSRGYDHSSLYRIVRDALEQFLPSTPSYDVRIVPVYQEHYVRYTSRPQPRDMPNKKVIRIEVHQGQLPKIWQTGTNQVWVKRDGSVEELNPLEIKDLAISRYKQTLNLRGAKSR